MKVRKLKKTDSATWDQFVDKTSNGTLFHKIKFLSYHFPDKFSFTHLAFYDNDQLIAVLPGGIQNDIFKSPLGASYGSFTNSDLSFNKYEDLIDTLIKYMKGKVRKIQLTPPPIIYNSKPNQVDTFLFQYKKFKIEQQLITHAVNLEEFASQDDIMTKIKKRLRGDLNKSKRSDVIVEINNDYESFYPLLIDNKKKFDAKPTHTYDELIKLTSLIPEDMKLFMAYDKQKTPLAGVLLLIVNKTTILVFYICQNYTYQEKNAVSRLLYEAMVWSKKNKFKWFDIGVSMDTAAQDPMEPSRKLIFFKEGLNSSGYLRTTYSYTYAK